MRYQYYCVITLRVYTRIHNNSCVIYSIQTKYRIWGELNYISLSYFPNIIINLRERNVIV